MNRTLYLVDDHAVLRNGLRALLEPAGYQIVGETGDIDTAVADIVRLEPAAILLDLSLGERSGLELLGEMQRRKLRARVMVLSMMAQPRQIADAVRLGAMGYLLKGVTGAELITALDRACVGLHTWSADIAPIAAHALSTMADASAPQDPLQGLSLRESQVLGMAVRGKSSAAIAQALNLSVKTVETYRSRLMGKLGVEDITGLVRLAIREGLLDAGER